jgi:hypothetical protein
LIDFLIKRFQKIVIFSNFGDNTNIFKFSKTLDENCNAKLEP